jgi:CHAT domain-containing protein
VGTLWDIDDAEATDLMFALHRSLAAGDPPAVALRSAQLAAIHSRAPRRSHPGAWAAFEISGAVGD